MKERKIERSSEFFHSIHRDGNSLIRVVEICGKQFVSQVTSQVNGGDPVGDWWKSILLGATPEFVSGEPAHSSLVLVDLFCGSGGFSTGFRMAAGALGMDVSVALAVDTDKSALDVYKRNHDPQNISTRSVADLVDCQLISEANSWKFYYPPELVDDELKNLKGKVDIVIGGPPCQGHSSLNNHTRRDDGRNALYPLAVSLAIALDCQAMVIENVQAVLHDVHQSVPKSCDLLHSKGWSVDDQVMKAQELGWPQTRKRHFLTANKVNTLVNLNDIRKQFLSQVRPLSWAIDDLEQIDSDALIDAHSNLSPANIERVEFLFDNDLYELPNAVRPLKHQDGHTYPSSYGRLKWDEPAGTITTGFMTPGRGRFIHPRQRRPITAHEAARLQGFPDSYEFELDLVPPSKTALSKWIGDAVPIPLGYAVAFGVLAGFC